MLELLLLPFSVLSPSATSASALSPLDTSSSSSLALTLLDSASESTDEYVAVMILLLMLLSATAASVRRGGHPVAGPKSQPRSFLPSSSHHLLDLPEPGHLPGATTRRRALQAFAETKAALERSEADEVRRRRREQEERQEQVVARRKKWRRLFGRYGVGMLVCIAALHVATTEVQMTVSTAATTSQLIISPHEQVVANEPVGSVGDALATLLGSDGTCVDVAHPLGPTATSSTLAATLSFASTVKPRHNVLRLRGGGGDGAGASEGNEHDARLQALL